MQQSTYI